MKAMVAVGSWLSSTTDYIPLVYRVPASEGSGSFQQSDLVRVSFTAMSPDGTAINGLMSLAVGDGGIFGSGNGCLFSGFGIG